MAEKVRRIQESSQVPACPLGRSSMSAEGFRPIQRCISDWQRYQWAQGHLVDGFTWHGAICHQGDYYLRGL